MNYTLGIDTLNEFTYKNKVKVIRAGSNDLFMVFKIAEQVMDSTLMYPVKTNSNCELFTVEELFDFLGRV